MAPPPEPLVVSLVDSHEDEDTAAGGARQGSRRSRRLSESKVKPDHEVMFKFQADESDSRSAISITWSDFRRLRLPDGRTGEEQLLLNDTLVDWYLKSLESRMLDASRQRLRERMYIFSSFFLKRLRGALQQKDAGRRDEQMAALLKWVRVRSARASQEKGPGGGQKIPRGAEGS
jgi:Ulp1 family protease